MYLCFVRFFYGLLFFNNNQQQQQQQQAGWLAGWWMFVFLFDVVSVVCWTLGWMSGRTDQARPGQQWQWLFHNQQMFIWFVLLEVLASPLPITLQQAKNQGHTDYSHIVPHQQCELKWIAAFLDDDETLISLFIHSQTASQAKMKNKSQVLLFSLSLSSSFVSNCIFLTSASALIIIVVILLSGLFFRTPCDGVFLSSLLFVVYRGGRRRGEIIVNGEDFKQLITNSWKI